MGGQERARVGVGDSGGLAHDVTQLPRGDEGALALALWVVGVVVVEGCVG